MKNLRNCSAVLLLLALLHSSLEWCYKATYFELEGPIQEVDWSPDGKYIVVAASGSKRVTVYNAASGEVVWFATLTNAPWTAKFNNKGDMLAVAGENSDSVRLYSVPGFAFQSSYRVDFDSSSDKIFEVDFSANDNKLVACGQDAQVAQISLPAGGQDWSRSLDSNGDINSCKYASDNAVGTCCVGCSNQPYYRLRGSDGNTIRRKNGDGSRDCDFRPQDDQFFYAASTSQRVQQYDTGGANNVNNYVTSLADDMYAVSFAKDSSYMAVGGKNGHFYIINTATRTSPAQEVYYRRVNADIDSVRVSDDSNFVAVAIENGQIDIYARNCLQCPVGFYINGTTCRMCTLDLRGCQICTNSTVCTRCSLGYYLNTATKSCVICDASLIGCNQCRNSSVCIDCITGYYPVSNTCSRCSVTTASCQNCHSNGTCVKCGYNTYLTPTFTCAACLTALSNCLICTPVQNLASATNSTLVCLQCSRAFYVSAGVCVACPANCMACVNNGSCLVCANSFKLVGGVCSSCGTYCTACNNASTCLQCESVAFLNSGSCNLCQFPCVTCLSSAVCLSCAPGYWRNSTTCSKCSGCILCHPVTGVCSVCPSGQYLSAGNTCLPCLNVTSKCALCTASTCLLCERNFYWTGTACAAVSAVTGCEYYQKNSTTCEHCLGGFYLTAGTCSQCPLQCSMCESPTNCSQCQLGHYFWAANMSCLPCGSNCRTCNSSLSCISCGDETYLSGTQCLNCWQQIPNCNSCVNVTHCVNCQLGYRLASDSLSCIACVSPCSTCNATACLTCELGYYWSAGSCLRCPGACNSCTAANACQGCVPGYVLDAGACLLCSSKYSKCQYCNQAQCTACMIYHVLEPVNKTCIECKTNITNCAKCSDAGLCHQCSVGYYLAADKLSCGSCSVALPKCEKCASALACDSCALGYYLNTSNKCSACPRGCVMCTDAVTCIRCASGYRKNGTLCSQCFLLVAGCQECDSTGCLKCYDTHFLVSVSACSLCIDTLAGCLRCSSSSVCKACDSGYHLNGNTCSSCSAAVGCSMCNQTTSTCLSCLSGYVYNSSSSTCLRCSQQFNNCIQCNTSRCLLCESGSYLHTSGACNACTQYHSACIVCNQSQCLSCESGHYLSGGTCSLCGIAGCQLCATDGLSCLSCEDLYYRVGGLCSLCSSMDAGCLSCSGAAQCSMCKTGYYLRPNSTCALCSSAFSFCDACSATQCLTCSSNTFPNTTSPTLNCLQCSQHLTGCALCSSISVCQSCQDGYYMDVGICRSCTDSVGCLLCKSSSECMLCITGYYLDNGMCLQCGQAIQGCFQCANRQQCMVCSGSYMLSLGACVLIKGTPAKKYSELRMVTQYINATWLKHSLYSVVEAYMQIEQKWNQTVQIEILHNNKKIALKLRSVQWSTSNILTFYTDNPLGEISSLKAMQLVTTFNRRRLLLDELVDFGITTNLKIAQSVIAEILPTLDTNQRDLIMESPVSSPEFYRSVLSTTRHYYYFFGYGVTVLFVTLFLLKICWLVPSTPNPGNILPHVLLLKAPALVLYPIYEQYYSYCHGFMLLDLGWFNNWLAVHLTNLLDLAPISFRMYYTNANIASTYLLPLGVYFVAYVVMSGVSYWRYTVIVRNQILDRELINTKVTSRNENEDLNERTMHTRLDKFIALWGNVFLGGLCFAAVMNLLGVVYNPGMTLSVGGGFYILGVLLLVYLLVVTLREFTLIRANINKLRVLLKCALLVLSVFSSVILLIAIVVCDGALIAVEYLLNNKHETVSKVWIVSNALPLLSYASLLLLPNMLLGLVLASVLVLGVLAAEGYLVYYERMAESERMLHSRITNNMSKSSLVTDENDLKKNEQTMLEFEEPATMEIVGKMLRGKDEPQIKQTGDVFTIEYDRTARDRTSKLIFQQ